MGRAGDAEFRIKAYERMAAFVNGARIILLASHHREMLEAWCIAALLLEEGRVAADGPLTPILDRAVPREGGAPQPPRDEPRSSR